MTQFPLEALVLLNQAKKTGGSEAADLVAFQLLANSDSSNHIGPTAFTHAAQMRVDLAVTYETQAAAEMDEGRRQKLQSDAAKLRVFAAELELDAQEVAATMFDTPPQSFVELQDGGFLGQLRNLFFP